MQVRVATPACRNNYLFMWSNPMCKPLWFLPFLAVAFTPSAHADDAQPCDSGTVEAIARWAEAGVNGKLVEWNKPDGLIAAAACKAMPNAPGTTIAAIAFGISHEKMSGYADGYKLQVIALVEAGKVVAATQSILEEDAATAVGSYRIDTARYILSKDVRAFGVVFYNSAPGPSCPEQGQIDENEYLTLFIREGERLRAMFVTHLYEWNLIDGGSCSLDNKDARRESARMIIGVEKTSSHGFADLSITAHVTEMLFKHNEGVSVTGKRTIRRVLKYDGQSYGKGYNPFLGD